MENKNAPSKLQQLLDEKWPMTGSLPDEYKYLLEMVRKAFSEGYNAANSEIESPIDIDLVEKAAMEYAYTQDIHTWQQSKKGYMAGAQDWAGKIIKIQNHG